MDRLTLAVVLGVLLPLPAPAQRVEIAPFVGAYAPLSRVYTRGEQLYCDDQPCPSTYRRFDYSAGAAFGGRLTLQVGPRFGLDATMHRVHGTAQVSGDYPGGGEDVTATVITVQPRLRVQLDEVVELAFALGPAAAMIRAIPDSPGRAPRSGESLGLAFSSAFRAAVAKGLAVELQASELTFPGEADWARNGLVYGVGLVFAVKR